MLSVSFRRMGVCFMLVYAPVILAQELHGAQQSVPGDVHERKRVPAKGDLDHDQAQLRLHGVGERGLGIGPCTLHNGGDERGDPTDDEQHDRGCVR